MVKELKEILTSLGYSTEEVSKLLPEGLMIAELAKLDFVKKVAGQALDIISVKTDYVTPLFMVWGAEALRKSGYNIIDGGHYLVTTQATAGFKGPFDVKASNGTQMKIWVSTGTLDEFHKTLGLAEPLPVKPGVGRCRSLTPSEYQALPEEGKRLFSPSLAAEVRVKGLNRPARRGGMVEISTLILKWGQLTQEGRENLATAIIRGLKVVLGVDGSRITLTLGGLGEPLSLPRKANVPAAN